MSKDTTYTLTQAQRDSLLKAYKGAIYAINGREHTGFIEDAVALLQGIQSLPSTPQDADNCPFCAGTVQRTDHLDSDDNIKNSTVRCKPCNYTMPLEKFIKRTSFVLTKRVGS